MAAAPHDEVRESLELLRRDWDMDPVLCDFVLGRAGGVSDRPTEVRGVTFHIPYLESHAKYVLWGCRWPDCHNCCERQGRLPLTSDDLVTIGRGLKYRRTSEFVRAETLVATYGVPTPSGAEAVMTTVNLKRRQGETEAEDGTRVPCRFLDGGGACTMHPARPGVCRLYPFSPWVASEGGRARVHAAYQLTGDCPGFYLADSVGPMAAELDEYSGIVYEYAMSSGRTARDGFSAASAAAG